LLLNNKCQCWLLKRKLFPYYLYLFKILCLRSAM
jgi:hypothetical protein